MKSFNYRKWCDEFVLAGKGILLATREKRFWAGFVPAFLIFGTLINLLAGGLAKFDLMAASGFGGSVKIILDSLLGLFGYRMIISDWLQVFALALVQSSLLCPVFETGSFGTVCNGSAYTGSSCCLL